MFRKKGNTEQRQELDPLFEAKVRRFEQTHAALYEVHQAVGAFTQALAVMCASAKAVAGGLEKLCAHEEDPQALKDVVRTFSRVHEAIDAGIRMPMRKVANDTVLRDLGLLLTRMPPVLKKIEIRRALVSEFDAASDRLRVETVRDPAGTEAAKLATRVETAAKSINQTTQDITADLDEVDNARPAVLRPVSALVGCELFLFGRSADLLQGLAARLPLSSTSLSLLATEVPRPSPLIFRSLSSPLSNAAKPALEQQPSTTSPPASTPPALPSRGAITTVATAAAGVSPFIAAAGPVASNGGGGGSSFAGTSDAAAFDASFTADFEQASYGGAGFGGSGDFANFEGSGNSSCGIGGGAQQPLFGSPSSGATPFDNLPAAGGSHQQQQQQQQQMSPRAAPDFLSM